MSMADFSDFPHEPFHDELRQLIDQQIERNHDLIEQMCELMLTTPGDYGVLVTDLGLGSIRAQLSKDVPFGEIHYVQGPDA